MAVTADARRQDVRDMCQQAVDMLALVWKAFRAQDPTPLAAAAPLGRAIHEREKLLTAALVARPPAERADPLAFVPLHLERIGDNIELLARAVGTMIAEGVPFTERAMRELNALFERALELLECVRDLVATGNRVLARHVLEAGQAFERTADEYAAAHQARLVEGVCLARASSLYLALLDDLRGVEWHARRIAEAFARAPATAS